MSYWIHDLKCKKCGVVIKVAGGVIGTQVQGPSNDQLTCVCGEKGYSSFENILKLNIDYIKIDGSLIRNMDTNIRHAIVVETIVDFSKKIGAKTIAEYVCNEDIYNKSKLLRIDYAQGYYIGKPDILS